MKGRLRSFLPPDRSWVVIQGSMLTAATLFLAARILLMPPAAAATPPPARRAPVSFELPAELRQELARAFPGDAPGSDGRSLFATLVPRLEELDLVLESHAVDPVRLGDFPPRSRVRLVVVGEPGNAATFLRVLDELPMPMRLADFEWAAGSGPAQRSLSLTLELLAPPAGLGGAKDDR